MKNLITFLCVLLFFSSCKKEEFKRELIISANGILSGGKYEDLSESDGDSKSGYSVYLHKGNIKITDEMLNISAKGAYKHSNGVF